MQLSFFAGTAVDRYSVSPRNDLKPDAGGSVDLYIQNASPGKERESNWLPAPQGKFVRMLRMYWPKEKAPSILRRLVEDTAGDGRQIIHCGSSKLVRN